MPVTTREIERDSDGEEAVLAGAIERADLNALRMALFQLTKDPKLAAMKVRRLAVRGGVFTTVALAPEHHAEVKQIAFDVLRTRKGAATPAPSSPAATKALVEMFVGEPVPENILAFAAEELAFEDIPREVAWTRKPAADRLKDFSVVIIGAGICGLATAVHLERLGIPYTIIERLPGLGGTWELNRYPDVRVDIPSFVYQYKFEKKYPWKQYYASGEQSLAYLRGIAAKYGVLPRIRFETHVTSALWDEASSQWVLHLRDAAGKESTLTARVLVSASGLFSTAKLPDIEGIRDFAGVCCHTTEWTNDFDPTGKRVAVIGNGSTGTQLTPYLAEKAAQLTLYQRTPQWIIPTENYRAHVPSELQWLMDHVPYYWNWHCLSQFMGTFQLQVFHYFDRDWQKRGGIVSEQNDKLRAYLTNYIREKLSAKPDLIQKVTPTFPPLARRLVVDNGWYDALLRDNVDLVTDRIARFTRDGILSADGTERKYDLIVLATGFQTTRYLYPVRYEGRNGRTLEEAWKKDGPRAYLGMTLPDYPNFFMLYGPNSQPRTIGHYTWAEVWANYVSSLIVAMIEGNHKTLECRPDLFASYNEQLDRELEKIIWSEGKGGYHLNERGRSVIHSPWKVEDYRRLYVNSGLHDYILA